MTDYSEEKQSCPDEGTCHHKCVGGCFRVQFCGPLSAAKFPDDQWPAGCVEVYGQPKEWEL